MWVWHFQEVILQKQHPFIYTFLCHRWRWMHCSANEAMSGHRCSAVGGDRGPGAGSRYLPAQRKGGRHQCYYESLEFTCGLGAFNASRRVRGGEWKGSILYQHKWKSANPLSWLSRRKNWLRGATSSSLLVHFLLAVKSKREFCHFNLFDSPSATDKSAAGRLWYLTKRRRWVGRGGGTLKHDLTWYFLCR